MLLCIIYVILSRKIDRNLTTTCYIMCFRRKVLVIQSAEKVVSREELLFCFGK